MSSEDQNVYVVLMQRQCDTLGDPDQASAGKWGEQHMAHRSVSPAWSGLVEKEEKGKEKISRAKPFIDLQWIFVGGAR